MVPYTGIRKTRKYPVACLRINKNQLFLYPIYCTHIAHQRGNVKRTSMNEILSNYRDCRVARLAQQENPFVLGTYVRENQHFLPVSAIVHVYRPKLSGKCTLCVCVLYLFLIFRLSAHSGVFSSNG